MRRGVLLSALQVGGALAMPAFTCVIINTPFPAVLLYRSACRAAGSSWTTCTLCPAGSQCWSASWRWLWRMHTRWAPATCWPLTIIPGCQ